MKTTRLNLDLNEQTKEKLERAKGLTQSSSMVDVVRRALALFIACLENEQQGGKVILKTKDGQESVIIIF